MQADLHRDRTAAYGGGGRRESGEGGPPAPPAAGKRTFAGRRSRTVSLKTIARESRREPVDPELAPYLADLARARPRCRAECEALPRPCPFLSCRYHLFLDVSPAGSIKFNFPEQEPWELAETCALDVADRGGVTLEEVGAIMNITRERTRQIEGRGLLRLQAAANGGRAA